MRHKMKNTGLFRRAVAMLMTACMLTNGFSPLALSQTTDTAQANAAYTVEDGTQNESSPQAPPENVTGSEPKVDPESGVPEDDLPGSEPQEPVSNAIDGQASWLSV